MDRPRKKVLFVCAQNRLRSPTAEKLYSGHPRWEVKSAGTESKTSPVTKEIFDCADIVFVFEKIQRNRLKRSFFSLYARKRVVCLDIPDEYNFMDPDLVNLLKIKLKRYLGKSSER